MNIQAIIVTYNNAATIETCLQSLQANNISAIVIDNASTDNTVQQAQQFPNVQIIVSAKNIGFAAAANQAANQSFADNVLFLNPDAILAQGASEQINDALSTYPEAGILGLLLCTKNGLPEVQSFGTLPSPTCLIQRKLITENVPTQPRAVGWVSGGGMLVRRNLWQHLGGFDTHFFLYWEDVDLCARAKRVGSRVFLLPHIKVTHIRGVSFTNNTQKTKIYDQSADRYYRKHYAFPIWGILHLGRYLYRLLGYQAK